MALNDTRDERYTLQVAVLAALVRLSRRRCTACKRRRVLYQLRVGDAMTAPVCKDCGLL